MPHVAGVSTTVEAGVRSDDGEHIVDQLIRERTPGLASHPLWPVLRPLLYRFLHYREAVRMADGIATLDGRESLEAISRLLALDVRAKFPERIPREGPCIVAPTHPTGIGDGIAVYNVLKRIRADLTFFANRDALRVNPRFADIVIPVEWRSGERSHAKSRDTLARTATAFRAGKAVVLFPSGRIAYWGAEGLTERPWQHSIVQLARRFDAPIVPVHLSSRNSGFFYLVSRFSDELRDMTVFHEMLNKRGKPFRMVIGRRIDPADLAGDTGDVTTRLQHHAEKRLAADPHARF